ncbi:hypothetical protein U9M48_043724 [Paspalum notatum var. saurae]|uniref:Uncharacterized protein n=1 Tax=Paspalum notatum var. saurae TaxID=547442 RepID=A0AAQ3UZU5_PASNO
MATRAVAMEPAAWPWSRRSQEAGLSNQRSRYGVVVLILKQLTELGEETWQCPQHSLHLSSCRVCLAQGGEQKGGASGFGFAGVSTNH